VAVSSSERGNHLAISIICLAPGRGLLLPDNTGREEDMATILITGANRGIGLQLATILAGRGDTVIGAVRDPGKADAFKALGKTVELVQVDVTDEASLAAAAKSLASRPVHVLIANAGVMGPRGGAGDENPADAWAHVLATNVTGPFLTARAFLANVVAAKGKIAILSSRMGSSAAAAGNSYVYRASKAAASNIAANLAAELKGKGVAVASYHPGWVQTDMGGAGADIPATVSAAGLVARIDALSLATTGAFQNYDGTTIPF
jgi:NAD(P)-dependent dehydrogenase (short-subunit alcohol dehydrogenase family)